MTIPNETNRDEVATRLAAAEAHSLSLERRLLDYEHRRDVSERSLQAEKWRNRALRKELERLRKDLNAAMRLLSGFRDAIKRLFKSRRWSAANIMRPRERAGYKPIDILLNKLDLWRPRSGRMPDRAFGEPDSYDSWLKTQRTALESFHATEASADRLASSPCFCLVMHVPVKFDERLIEKSVQSVVAQSWKDWRLLIVGGTARTRSGAFLDERIIVAECAGDFPVEATHAGALGCGDILEKHALHQVARLDRILGNERPLDLIYTDEDEYSTEGVSANPFFKPAWSPETLESFNCVGSLAVYRREFLAQIGASVAFLHPDAGYDLALRAAEQHGIRAERLPWMLYHRRPLKQNETVNLQRLELEALRAAVRRRGAVADAEITPQGLFHVKRAIFKHERVSILIPTRDRLELLRRSVDTLKSLTQYRNYEIIIINNESSEPWTLEWLASCGHRVVDFPGSFNYAAMHNAAVRTVDSPWLCFLNNDTEIIDPFWLGAMCEQVQRPEIGCVGAKLLFPDGLVQHAGVVLGIQGRAAHAFAGKQADHAGARGQLHAVRNYSAVTAACMMMRRAVFEELGGFDEKRFPVAYNDVDLCVRALRHGYRNVYTPHAILKHHECATRPRIDNPHEVAALRELCLGPHGWTDPFYHPSLSHEDANFTFGLE